MFYGGEKGRTKWLWALTLGGLGVLLLLVFGCSMWNRPTDRQGKAVPDFRWNAGDVKGFLTNARYLELMGRPSMALKELEEAHRLFPRDVKVADALAHYYEKVGMPREGREIYRDALEVAPDNPTLWNNLGFSYYQSGDEDRAEECYRKALAAQPNYEAGRNNLGLLLCRLGRRQEARQLWQAREGEAAAATKMSLALGALGMTPETHYAGLRPSPATGVQPRVPEPAGPPATVKAETAPPPAPAPSRPVACQLAPAVSPTPTPPEVAAGKLAAVVLPQTQPALSGNVRRPAAPPQPQPRRLAAAWPASPAPPAITSPDSSAVPPPRKMAAVTPPRPAPASPSPSSGDQPAAAVSRARRAITRALVPPPAELPRPKYLTAGELMGTNIVILNGNGIQNLARRMRSRLNLEGFTIASIGNFRDFGVDQTVIYYRPAARHVAATLNHDFFPQAVLQPASRLPGRIDVKVVLGHDFPSPVRAAAGHPRPGQS
jgi:hypothetical protein